MEEPRGPVCYSPVGGVPGSLKRPSINTDVSKSPRLSPYHPDISASAQVVMDRADYWGDFGLKTGMEYAFGLTDPTSKGEWMVSDEERPEKWSSVCLHFTQNTTFHGINKITENTPFPVRRVIWVFIIMGGVSLFLTQMARSIMHYCEHPVTVNTRIIYTKAIPFPAVTICNQNVFRMSEAAVHGHYELLDDIYSKDSIRDVNLTSSDMNITMKHLYDIIAHDKQDMIIGCVWDRQICTADDFETTITEHGVCMTFNGLETKQPKIAGHTGSDRGLRLKLNIEQYEYMRGPNSAVGVKILVHDRAEVPFVREFGQAISPASHAFVSIQKTQITNLEAPYGECEWNKELQFFKNYTIPNCKVDCFENFLRKTCRCRLPHMPEFLDSPGEPLVCNLREVQDCVHPMKEKFEEAQKSEDEWDTNKCRCPVPCERSKFDTAISYGTMSHRDHKKGRHTHIQERFIKARETLQRVDQSIAKQDKSMVDQLERAIVEIASTFDDVENKMNNVSQFLDVTMRRMEHRIYFHQEYALAAVEKAVLYGFVQPFDIDQQNFFEPLSTGSKQFVKRYRKTLNKMLNITSHDVLRRALLWRVEEDLSTKLDLAIKARESLQAIHESFSEGVSQLPYNWSLSKRYDKKCVPKELLRHSIGYQVKIYHYLDLNIDTVIGTLEHLRHAARHAFKKDEFNNTQFREIRHSYLESIKSINYGQNLFKEGVVYKTKTLMKENIFKFSKKVETLRRERDDVNITVKNCFDLITKMRTDAWPHLINILNISREYTLDKSRSKLELAKKVTSRSLATYTQHAVEFFSDVRARARNFNHDWQKFRDAIIAVWKGIKYEQTTHELYAKIAQDFLQIAYSDNNELREKLIEPFNKTLGTSDVQELYFMTNADMMNTDSILHVANRFGTFNQIKSESDLTEVIQGKDNMFLEALSTWKNSLKDFTRGSKLDDEFFKNNFLEIDVYMTELYYELVEQRVAYDLTHLWSDIGGSMGLFVGASVITVFELLDAILHNFLKVQLQETKQRRRSLAIARSQDSKSKQSNAPVTMVPDTADLASGESMA